MIRAGFRACRAAPMTTLFVAVCVGLYIAVHVVQTWHTSADDPSRPLRFDEAQRLLGGVSAIVHRSGPQLFVGWPVDVWNGQWWRIIVSAFHHGNLLHLALNMWGLWCLGALLESRLNKAWYFLFVLSASAISMLPDHLLGNQAVGISGALFAIFGMLTIMRHRDQVVADIVTELFVRCGYAWLVVGVLLTHFDILPIANAAHFSGMIYGWLTGQIFFGAWSRRRLVVPAFLAMHLALLPGYYLAVHPIGDGNYYWFLAEQSQDRSDRIRHLETAVGVDPGLSVAWLELVEEYLRGGDRESAWKTVLLAVRHHRTFQPGIRAARKAWLAMLQSGRRQQALQILDEVFGGEVDSWKERLGLGLPIAQSPEEHSVFLDSFVEEQSSPEPDLSRFRLDQAVELPNSQSSPEGPSIRDLSAPPVDPDTPESASVGIKL